MIQGMFKLSVMGSGFSQGFTDVCACDAVKKTCSSGCSGGDAFRSMGGIGAMNKQMPGGAPVIDWGNGGPSHIFNWTQCMVNLYNGCLDTPMCNLMWNYGGPEIQLFLLVGWSTQCSVMSLL